MSAYLIYYSLLHSQWLLNLHKPNARRKTQNAAARQGQQAVSYTQKRIQHTFVGARERAFVHILHRLVCALIRVRNIWKSNHCFVYAYHVRFVSEQYFMNFSILLFGCTYAEIYFYAHYIVGFVYCLVPPPYWRMRYALMRSTNMWNKMQLQKLARVCCCGNGVNDMDNGIMIYAYH